MAMLLHKAALLPQDSATAERRGIAEARPSVAVAPCGLMRGCSPWRRRWAQTLWAVIQASASTRTHAHTHMDPSAEDKEMARALALAEFAEYTRKRYANSAKKRLQESHDQPLTGFERSDTTRVGTMRHLPSKQRADFEKEALGAELEEAAKEDSELPARPKRQKVRTAGGKSASTACARARGQPCTCACGAQADDSDDKLPGVRPATSRRPWALPDLFYAELTTEKLIQTRDVSRATAIRCQIMLLGLFRGRCAHPDLRSAPRAQRNACAVGPTSAPRTACRASRAAMLEFADLAVARGHGNPLVGLDAKRRKHNTELSSQGEAPQLSRPCCIRTTLMCAPCCTARARHLHAILRAEWEAYRDSLQPHLGAQAYAYVQKHVELLNRQAQAPKTAKVPVSFDEAADSVNGKKRDVPGRRK